jgi:hypothetical protein
VGFLVEHLLHEEKKRYDATHGPDGVAVPPPPQEGEHPIHNAHLPHVDLRLANLRPGKIGWEVFGGLILLKLASTGVKLFRHKHQSEPWFESAARIHTLSGSLAAYTIAKSLKAKRVSASRNAWAVYYLTTALKPVLAGDPKRMAAAAKARKEAAKQAAKQAKVTALPPPQAAPEPQPQPYDHTPQPAPGVITSPDYEGHGTVAQPVSIGDPSAVEQPHVAAAE